MPDFKGLPDAETLERLRDTMQFGLHPFYALQLVATIDKLAEALRVLADKRTTNESARVDARALLAHLGLEGGERG